MKLIEKYEVFMSYDNGKTWHSIDRVFSKETHEDPYRKAISCMEKIAKNHPWNVQVRIMATKTEQNILACCRGSKKDYAICKICGTKFPWFDGHKSLCLGCAMRESIKLEEARLRKLYGVEETADLFSFKEGAD